MKSIFSKKKWGIMLAVLLLISASIAAGTTFAKYISEIPVGSFSLRIEPVEQAYAVFTEEKSFELYYGIYPEVGEKLSNGKTVKNVYRNIDTTAYDYDNNRPAWYQTISAQVTSVYIDASFAEVRPISVSSWFRGFSQITSIQGLENLNTSEATDMSAMFAGCSKITSLDVSGFDTSKVTNMRNMFAACYKLKTLNLSNFNTSQVTNMSFMFSANGGTSSLTSVTFGSNFDTSNVKTMELMFNNCSRLTTLDLSSFNISNVTSMEYMFGSCIRLKTIAVSDKWGTVLATNKDVFAQCDVLAGGNGTTYQERQTYHMQDGANHDSVQPLVANAGYAVIDGQNGQHGYLTAATGVSVNYVDVTVQVEAGAPFTNSGFATSGQHHFFTEEGLNTIILTAADNTPYSGDVVITSGTSTETITVTDGKLAIPTIFVTDGATITLSAAAETQLLEDSGLVHLSASCDPAEIIPGQAFTITLTPDAGYILPATVTVTIDGEDKTSKVTYENGVITIPAELVTEGITISVTAEAKQQITVSIGEGLKATPGVPIPGKAFTVTLTGETLPDAVTVTIDGADATTAVYDKATGTITIPGDLLTSETTSIAITTAASEAPTTICNCTSKCEESAANTDCPVCSTATENCSPVICTCETTCAEDAGNAECPVCRTDATKCSPKEPETVAECGCTVKCAEGSVNADCEVCAGDWSQCKIQADPAPTEATPTITVNTDGVSNLSFTPDAAPAINQDYTAGIAPVDGYTLPKTITVTIGTDRYTVNLSGENEDGKPDFEGGKLVIPGTLLTGETTITIEAAGVAVPADEDNSGEETQPPADEQNSGEETQPPADENSPGENTQPPADENTQPPAEEDIPDESEQPSAPPVEVITEDAAPPKEPEEEETPTETPTEGDPQAEE